MIKKLVSEDLSDLLFRLLFSIIFLGLGFEHLFHDELIQNFMPLWVPSKRLASIACGVLLVTGGGMILIGLRVHLAASVLGVFLVVVTALVHGPALFSCPSNLHSDCCWLWDLYQRSNFVKNLCLLGVCFHLLHHDPGRFSYDGRKRA